MGNPIPSEREVEVKQFTAALAQMRESELERLLDISETLVQQLRCIKLHNSESAAATVAARRLVMLWNNEVQHILEMKRKNDAVQLE